VSNLEVFGVVLRGEGGAGERGEKMCLFISFTYILCCLQSPGRGRVNGEQSRSTTTTPLLHPTAEGKNHFVTLTSRDRSGAPAVCDPAAPAASAAAAGRPAAVVTAPRCRRGVGRPGRR